MQQSAKFLFYLAIWTIYNVFGEYQQDFISLMWTFYGINVCYYVYICWSHFSKLILTTKEVIKKLSETTNVILATNKLVSATKKVI